MEKSIFLLALLSLAAVVSSAKFPAKWKKCPKTNNEECLKVAVKEVIMELKNGNKELNVIPLDPLHFKRMEMNQGSKSPVNVNLTFYDMDIIGSSRLEIRSIKTDWDKYTLEASVDVVNGQAHLLGDYTINGKVLVLPITGQGKSNITFDGFNVKLKLIGSELVKKGKKYLKADEVEFKIYANRTYFHLANLFDGVPNLGDNMNKFLNENQLEILSELRETISKAIGQGLTQIANQIFGRFPLDQIYSE